MVKPGALVRRVNLVLDLMAQCRGSGQGWSYPKGSSSMARSGLV